MTKLADRILGTFVGSRPVGALDRGSPPLIAPGTTATLERLRPLLPTVLAGTAGAVSVAYLTSQNPMAAPEGLAVGGRVLIIMIFVLAGVYAQTRVVQTEMGRLLSMTGLFACLWLLNGSANAVAFSVGMVFSGFAPAVAASLLLAHPTGRLPAGRPRAFLVVTATTMVTCWILLLISGPQPPIDTPLMHCSPNCPRNVWFLGVETPLKGLLTWVSVAAWLVLTAGTLVILVKRLLAGGGAARRTMAPVVAASAVNAAFLVGFLITHRAGVPASEELGTAYVACAPLIPIGIFAGLGLERLFMGDALARFVGQLPGSSAAQVERSMAAALRDPSLEIVYRRSGWEGYVDVDGSPVDITALGEDRAVVGIQQDGLVVAAVLFDSDLGHQRRFVAAAGEAALMWLAKARVEAELAASARELQVSRRRLLHASVAERRRIQRDLHDSTQQRLLAMSMKLGLAHDSLREQPRDAEVMLTGLQSELEETLSEVRSLVNGVYPPVLTDYGLLRALRGAARRSQTAVTLQAEDIGRHPAEVEGAVYFACLEALQNVDKHAGPRAQVTLRLWLEEGGLRFEVHDSGRGFEPDHVLAGAGLLSMRDRVEALDGTLSVTSRPGEGTAVAGTIPLAA